MEQQKVDMFMMSNGKFFAQEKVGMIREKLLTMDESKWGTISTIQYKDPTTALILSILLGYLGIDRFYTGQIGLGVVKLLTGGACGIWWLIDIFLISGAAKETNFGKLSVFLH